MTSDLFGFRVATDISDVPRLDFPLMFTSESLRALRESVGARPPESGAKAFGPADRFGIDVVEFDSRGSERSSRGRYNPDADWGYQRVEHWLAQRPQKLWTADCHSHPGGSGRPSSKAGNAQGDLGYVEAVFQANEALQYFAIPIITHPGTETPTLWPWVCRRAASGVALFLADVQLGVTEEFPTRPFPDGFDGGVLPAAPRLPDIDLDRLARDVEGEVRFGSASRPPELRVLKRGVRLTIELPDRFPDAPPVVLLPTVDDSRKEHRASWKRGGRVSVEERLAGIVNETVRWLLKNA